MAESNPLMGVWRIVAIQVEIEDATERRDLYDKQPSGFLIITDNRMMALITAGNRASDASGEAFFENMMAYSGRYRMNGDSMVTTVDAAWHPAWIGTEQTRFVKFDGHTLSLSSPPQQHPKFPRQLIRGIAIWQREQATF